MGEAHSVDILAGGVEPRMGLRLLDDCRVSMKFIEGADVCAERA